MMSPGQKLYEVWFVAMQNQGVDVDAWHSLSDEEKAAWEEVAEVTGA